MRNRFLSVGLLSLLVFGMHGVSDLSTAYAEKKPLKTVEAVDLQRYMGKWYEIAAIPMYFERQCKTDATAEYTLLPDQQVKVDNSCQIDSGERSYSEGRAKVVDPETNAKLKVTFLHFLGWRYIASGDYWITALDKDYQYAIVGHPSRKYGWILSRKPQMDSQTLQALSKELMAQGYDTCKFLITPQTGGLEIKKPLCKTVN